VKITFRNLSGEHIELTLNGKTTIIAANSSEEILVDYGELTFSLNTYRKSSLSYFIRRAGLIRKKDFCVLTTYKTSVGWDSVITNNTMSAKGRFFDTYCRVTATCDNFPITFESCRVADEKEMRKEFADAQKRGNRTILLFDILDILGNAFTVLLLLLIPFALIWLFGSFETAYTVCGYLFIPIFAIIVIINRVFDKYKKKLWYFAKGKALKNSVYKGTDSHFEEEYIKEIFSSKF